MNPTSTTSNAHLPPAPVSVPERVPTPVCPTVVGLPVSSSTAMIRTRNPRRLWIDILKDDYKNLWYWKANKAGRATRLWGSVYENNDDGITVRRSKRLKKGKGTKVIGLICM